MRRQIQSFNPYGQPGFGFAFPNQFPSAQPGQGQGTFVGTSSSLHTRFGDDEPTVSGQSTVFHHKDGKYQQTNTYVRPDGSVTTDKHSGRF